MGDAYGMELCMPPSLRASEIEGRDCRCGCWVGMGGGGSFLLSEVRRESGGEIRPETCEAVGQLPLE